jgi:hypothetical protein
VVSGGFVEGDFLAGEAFEFGDERVLLWLAGGYVLYCWLISIRIL